MSYPIAKLGEVAEFIRGITFKPDDVVPLDADDAIVCMRTKNVQTLLDCDDLLAVPSKFVRRKDQYLVEGDILVSSANSWNLVGKCCWVPSLPWRAAFGGFISVLRGASERVDRRYLYWWFASERTQALLRSFGQKTTNISNLNIDRCLQLDLPLPTLAEQRRIAAILDKADALRTKRRHALAQLDTLAHSIFAEMFGDPLMNPKGWPTTKLEHHLIDVTNGLTRRGSEVEAGKDIVLRLRDIRAGSIDFSEPNRITLNEKERAKYQVLPGDLLFIRVNGNPEYVGRCALFEGHPEETYFNDHVMRVRLKAELSGGYLAFFLNRPEGKREIAKHRKTSAGQHTINQDGLGAIMLPLPDLPLQHKFNSHIRTIRKSSAMHLHALSELDALFASSQFRAFRGEL